MNTKKLAAAAIAAIMTCVTGIQASAGGTQTAEAEYSGASAKNNTDVKILSFYDVTEDGKSYAAVQFKKKYGGEIKYYPTTWASRYDNLSTFVLGDAGIDLFPMEEQLLPKAIISGLVQPVDKYVSVKKSTFNKFGNAMNAYKFGGKHYCMVTDVKANYMVFYNKKTIKEHHLKDPYTLWKNGKWNWDTFESELESFVDTDEKRYGLDGWYFDKALAYSAGKPVISNKSGKLVLNTDSKQLNNALEFAEELYDDELIMDKSDFYWNINPQFMGEGKELFYITASWEITTSPDTWSMKIAPEDLGIVPVPSPKGSKNYMYASVSGYALLNGADNPKYAVKYAELEAKGTFDKKEIAKNDKTAKNEYKLSSKNIKAIKEINNTARKYPVIDLTNGTSDDICDLLVYNTDTGLTSPFYGIPAEEAFNNVNDVADLLVDEVNEELEKIS